MPPAWVRPTYIIVAVPTPVREAHQPDFSPLIGASVAAGRHMKRGVITAGVHRASSIKVVDIVNELKSYGVETLVHDPEADPGEAMREYGIRLLDWESLPRADAVVAAVAPALCMAG